MIDWIKIEDGCKMPAVGDFCIVVLDRWDTGARLAWKDWDGEHWHNRGIIDTNEKPTHWAFVNLPDGD